jgi:hypothetical protein
MTTISPVEVTCPDCDRTFTLITELQLKRTREAGDRCPTCTFNHKGRGMIGFVPRTPR